VRKSSRRLTSELLALDERLSVDLDVFEDSGSMTDGGGDLLRLVELKTSKERRKKRSVWIGKQRGRQESEKKTK